MTSPNTSKIVEFLRKANELPLDKDELLMLFLLEGEFMPRQTMKKVFSENDQWINENVAKLFKAGYIKKTGRGNIFSLSKRGNEAVMLLMEGF